jgi:hypothetical protein
MFMKAKEIMSLAGDRVGRARDADTVGSPELPHWRITPALCRFPLGDRGFRASYPENRFPFSPNGSNFSGARFCSMQARCRDSRHKS